MASRWRPTTPSRRSSPRSSATSTTHLRRLHTGIELAVDGEWDQFTDQAFKQVCKVLGLAPELNARTFRIIAGTPRADPARSSRAPSKQGAAFAER